LEIGATIGLIERVTADLQKDGLDLYRGIERMLASDPALGDRGPLPQGDGAEDSPEEPENH
jgi:hypothetical protein